MNLLSISKIKFADKTPISHKAKKCFCNDLEVFSKHPVNVIVDIELPENIVKV